MKRKNFTKRLFPAGLTVIALLLLGNLCLMVRETKIFLNWKADIKDWQEEMVCVLGEKMTDMLAPASAYLSEDHADTILEWMLTYIAQTIPVQGYLNEIAVKNTKGRNPFEEESSFYLEIEKMEFDPSTKEGDELVTEGKDETTIKDEGVITDKKVMEDEIIAEDKTTMEDETVKLPIPDLNSDSEVARLEESVNTENTGSLEEWEVTTWQEGTIFYYQPSVRDFAQEEETQEVFLSRLLQSSAYSLEKLKDFDFLMQKFFTVRETTSIRSGELSVEELLSHDVRMKGNNETPQILIYHSHSQEEFCDFIAGETGRQILDVGTYLSELLSKKYGYYVVHDMTTYDVKDGVMDKNAAYTYAGEGIERILEAYPSIEVVIDLHRDGVDESVHLVTEVNGKPTAKLMFVNGISRTTLQGDIAYLYNPYIKQNIAFSFHLQLAASQQYADWIRRTMISAYRYNLHYREKSLLIEVGAQTNTTEEAMNAMEPLAKLLNEVLG